MCAPLGLLMTLWVLVSLLQFEWSRSRLCYLHFLIPIFPPEQVLSRVYSLLQASNYFPDLGRGQHLPLNSVAGWRSCGFQQYSTSPVHALFYYSILLCFLFFSFLSFLLLSFSERKCDIDEMSNELIMERLMVCNQADIYCVIFLETLNYSDLWFDQLQN